MRLYIAGPMSGILENNYPAFELAATKLRDRGHDIVSPHECVVDQTTPWHVCMREDMKAMLTCDGIVLLDHWEHSKGATVEALVGKLLSFKLYAYVEHSDGTIELAERGSLYTTMFFVVTFLNKWFPGLGALMLTP